MLRRHICHQQFGKRYQTTQPHPLPDIDTDGFGYGKVVYLTNSRMHRNKQIAIILSDTLQIIGLQSMLTDYFRGIFDFRQRYVRLLLYKCRFICPLCRLFPSPPEQDDGPDRRNRR